MNPRAAVFSGGDNGDWHVQSITAACGETLAEVSRVQITDSQEPMYPDQAVWRLQGVTSNVRYATQAEKQQLSEKQAGLGRTEARLAALIPIRKTADWWELAQDRRRQIFEQASKHIRIGLQYLPAIARRLYHCRDLSIGQPFDFLTWFEFAPADSPAFDALLGELRATQEWQFVEREVDIRLVRE